MSDFEVGDNVEVAQLSDEAINETEEVSTDFIGKKGVITKINRLCIVNYYTVSFENNVTENFSSEELRKIEYLYIFIKGCTENFQFEGVDLFWDKDEAEKAFKVLTKHDYPKDGNWESIPKEYRNCYILKVEVPERKQQQ